MDFAKITKTASLFGRDQWGLGILWEAIFSLILETLKSGARGISDVQDLGAPISRAPLLRRFKIKEKKRRFGTLLPLDIWSF